MYFFADQSYLFKTDFKPFISNYGFWLTKGGIVSVDYVRVDYIGAKNKQ